jgi:hypothetical protein
VKAGIGLLAVTGIAMLLVATNVAVVGPCTSDLGAICLLAMITSFPVGVSLLLISIVRYLIQRQRKVSSASVVQSFLT